MTKSRFLVVLTLAAFSVSAVAAVRADELFSRISMDSAFNSPAVATEKAQPNGSEQPEKGRRVLSVGELTDLLREMGLEPQTDGDNSVTAKFSNARRKFPISITLSGDYERLQVSILLSQFDAKKPPSADRLLALLAANRELQPTFFSYNDDHRQIELIASLKNDQIGPRMLKAELDRLAAIAEGTAQIWEIDAKSAVGLVGKWSAARSTTEAFAMQLGTDGSFVLVSVKDGKQSKASGKFSLAGSQLVLATNEGGKLAGSVSNISADGFEFTPQVGSAGKLTFKRAR